MTENDLFHRLDYVDSARKNRQDAAELILRQPHLFIPLIGYCLNENNRKISKKAFWVLEFVCKQNIDQIADHLDLFFNHIHKITADSSIRSISKISELICIAYYEDQNPLFGVHLKKEHKDRLTECCFDWLIGDQKVAVKAHSMECLYYLGTENHWIHNELKDILNKGYRSHSAGYKARTRKILKSIQLFQSSSKPKG